MHRIFVMYLQRHRMIKFSFWAEILAIPERANRKLTMIRDDRWSMIRLNWSKQRSVLFNPDVIEQRLKNPEHAMLSKLSLVNHDPIPAITFNWITLDPYGHSGLYGLHLAHTGGDVVYRQHEAFMQGRRETAVDDNRPNMSRYLAENRWQPL